MNIVDIASLFHHQWMHLTEKLRIIASLLIFCPSRNSNPSLQMDPITIPLFGTNEFLGGNELLL